MAWRRLTRIAASFTLVAIGVATFSLGPASSAQAAPPEVLLSSDGITFSPTLSQGLFDFDKLVPGESLEASLWVRNPGTVAGLMRVMVDQLVVNSDAFRTGVTLSATEGGTTTSAAFGALVGCRVVVSPVVVPAGGEVRIDLSVAMSDSLAGLDGQTHQATLGFRVAMRDAVTGPFPPGNACAADLDSAATPFEGGLAYTGTALVGPTLGVAFVLLTGGALFLLIRRRRSREETEDS